MKKAGVILLIVIISILLGFSGSAEELSFLNCQENYSFCLAYNNCTNTLCQNYCLNTVPLDCSSWREILPLNCPQIDFSLPGNNDELTNPCAYALRDLQLEESGMIIKGHFDRQKEGPCSFPKEFYVYLPEGRHEKYRLLVVIHDSYGFAEDYLNFALNNSGPFNKIYFDAKGIVILAPQFNFYSSDCSYRNFDLFMEHKNDFENHRSDQWLLFLIDYLQQKIPFLDTEQLYLFGHSKGAQFLSAFAAAYPQKIKAVIFSAGGFYFGEDLSEIDASKTDLSFDFGELLQNHSVTIVVGKQDLDRRKCAAKKYVCDTVKKYCDFNEKPFFECESEVWNAPEKILMANFSNYCFNFQVGSCNLVENPCQGKKPEILGTAKCKFNFSWTDGSHSAENNYNSAAEFLFGE